MILDYAAELKTATAFDLDAKFPGPGKPIRMYAIGVGGPLVITTGAAAAAGDPLVTVDATKTVFFDLPSNTLEFIKATFATGNVGVILGGDQTNA